MQAESDQVQWSGHSAGNTKELVELWCPVANHFSV